MPHHVPHFTDKLDDIELGIIFNNAKRVASQTDLRHANWTFATCLFGCGSTVAAQICQRISIDPDARADGKLNR